MMRSSYIPSISELQAFSTCAETGATTRAAQKLNLTQSAISRSINSLETRLGVALFDRVKQRLVLSDAGRALQEDAVRLLAELEHAAMGVMAFGGHKNVLRLAVLPTLASTWLIPKLGEFQQSMPKMTFDISARLQGVNFEFDPFDAVICRSDSLPRGTHGVELMVEKLVVVGSAKLFDGQDLPDEEALSKLALLQQATRPNLWPDWFEHGGVDPRTMLRGARFDHFDMVLNAAACGLGIAVVPEVLAKPEVAAGRLVYLSKRRLIGRKPYMLLYGDRSKNIEGFEEFKNWLLRQASMEHANMDEKLTFG